ncbi:trypsin-like peptidase domain-containing protein [Mucilaginibacter aquariorum]|uniref:Trypsin-like peptidase domain-containing protein n=1 Tax=Mucilaginibacter aquariorum TaxID=2967225 RepID=A0ABT1SVI7_9SPHI|nr:trypsin-like peptidase domain-containing protein [Mucilaginibacter aquariorum]MCQ6956359.1 trypsin-like peptidase domain-containing protein [Mucilaginibacter aquariorum]
MNKYKALAIAAIQILVCAALITNAQQKNNKVHSNKEIPGYISQAIAKSYSASVLMWEIDAESGNRMSAQFSGVVVSKEGEILSAAHVVAPGKTYRVMFPDGRECTAKGLGRISIPPTFMLPDAAMLKIVDKGPWPFAQMGWSSSLSVNQPCISIAYPESPEQRKPNIRFGRITLLKNKHGFVQSSCVMEPGDSGGPLFDLLGRVIGIHSGIEVPEDVNYEVPVDTYRKYRSALNKPENYTVLPADTDAFVKDTLIASIKSIPPVKNLQVEFNKLNAQVKANCIKIKSVIDGKEEQISGTLLSLDGLKLKPAFTGKTVLLSKNSMVGESPAIILPGGEIVKARVLARSTANDLVLLLPAKTIGKGIKLDLTERDGITFNDLGQFLISPRPDSVYRTGVTGSMSVNLPKITSYGYIGATTALKDDKLVFASVSPGSAAEAGGVKPEDRLLTVDGHNVEDQLDFIKALQKYRAGDTTIITISRESKSYTKLIILKYPPQKTFNHPAELFPGGKSIRRDGFDNVFIHDTKIQPYECGGPVFKGNGHFMGINIARLSRTSSVAVPASTVRRFVSAVMVALSL